MSIRLGVVMDPIGGLDYKKDSTLAMLWAAAERGWPLFYMERQDLSLEQGVAMAAMAPLQVFREPRRYYRLGERRTRPLAELDAVLMRKDPPFDIEYIHSTYILEAAERQGALVVNRGQSLRDCNEKVFAAQFPECCPPLLVSASGARLKAFHAEHGDVVYKPLDGMGGAGVFRVREGDPNLNAILETLTRHGAASIMAQRHIPEISAGDKRVVLIDGQPLPYCLARLPMAGESRANLATGGRGVVQPLSERDRWIAERVGPALRERGLLFAGLDVIGDYLTEINVTSPTGIRELEAGCGLDIAGQLLDCMAGRLR